MSEDKLGIIDKFREFVVDEQHYEEVAKYCFFFGLLLGIPIGFEVGGLGGVLLISPTAGIISWIILPMMLIAFFRFLGILALLLPFFIVFLVILYLWDVGK